MDDEAIVTDAHSVFAAFAREGKAIDASHVVQTLEFVLAMIFEAHRDTATNTALREACEVQGTQIHHFAKGLRLQFHQTGQHALASIAGMPSGSGPTNDL